MISFLAEKERQLQNQQFDLVTKYAEMEMRQKQLQTSLDQAHQDMFEYKSKQEDLTSARSSEIDILNQDLERANEVTRVSPRLRLLPLHASFSARIERRTRGRQTSRPDRTIANDDGIDVVDENQRRDSSSGGSRSKTSTEVRVGIGIEGTGNSRSGRRHTETPIDVDQSEGDVRRTNSRSRESFGHKRKANYTTGK